MLPIYGVKQTLEGGRKRCRWGWKKQTNKKKKERGHRGWLVRWWEKWRKTKLHKTEAASRIAWEKSGSARWARASSTTIIVTICETSEKSNDSALATKQKKERETTLLRKQRVFVYLRRRKATTHNWNRLLGSRKAQKKGEAKANAQR